MSEFYFEELLSHTGRPVWRLRCDGQLLMLTNNLASCGPAILSFMSRGDVLTQLTPDGRESGHWGYEDLCYLAAQHLGKSPKRINDQSCLPIFFFTTTSMKGTLLDISSGGINNALHGG